MKKATPTASTPPLPDQPITCGPENVAHFNALLRSHLPEFHRLAQALHARGLIDGLRGAKIGPAGSLSTDGVVASLPWAAEQPLRAAVAPQPRRGGRRS